MIKEIDKQWVINQSYQFSYFFEIPSDNAITRTSKKDLPVINDIFILVRRFMFII